MAAPNLPNVLLTGATGYVGGRLLPLLAARAMRVRCLARDPERLRPRVPDGVEVARGDVLDPASLAAAMEGIDAAFYLVHSMGAEGDFSERDREGARHFGEAARAAGVRRIVYLGGLAEESSSLSPHLRSRHEVGDVLRASGVPVVELRASVVLGAGSLSFEMIRALVERLPVMVTPRWVRVPAQPIAVCDVLEYLIAALALPPGPGRTFEIGGADVVSYGDLMREYARQRGLRRWTIPVPVLTPRLSSLWLGLVTPLYARVGRKLIDSIRHPSVVRDDAALREFAVRPLGVREAIARALRDEDAEFDAARWSEALDSPREPGIPGGPAVRHAARLGNRLVDSRSATTAATPSAAFRAVERIGGGADRWHSPAWLWRVRGVLDRIAGGAGMRRGRRDPLHLAVGDALDCWRVTVLEPGTRLLLAAEMKLPGRAWMEYRVAPAADGRGAVLRQTAMFDPRGLLGLAYWYAVWPFHEVVFARMLRGLAREAEALDDRPR